MVKDQGIFEKSKSPYRIRTARRNRKSVFRCPPLGLFRVVSLMQLCAIIYWIAISQKLISFAISYLQTLKFHQVYLVSDHENLYEKYGFKVIDTKTAPWGEIEKIYMREI